MSSKTNPKKCLVIMTALLIGTGGHANADFTFGEPQNLGPVVNSPSDDGTPGISPDGLTLYFSSDRPGGLGYEDLWVSTRQSTNETWGPPENLTTVNSPYRESYPSLSADGLTLYFSDYFYGPDRPGWQVHIPVCTLVLERILNPAASGPA